VPFSEARKALMKILPLYQAFRSHTTLTDIRNPRGAVFCSNHFPPLNSSFNPFLKGGGGQMQTLKPNENYAALRIMLPLKETPLASTFLS